MSAESSKSNNAGVSQPEDAISIPLYLGGLAVSILGILAVNSALSDTQLGSTTIVLTTLGFFFSIGCRWLQIKPRLVEGFVMVLCLYLAFRLVTNTINRDFFIPPDVTQGDLVMAVVLLWLTVARAWIMTRDESVVFTTVTSVAMIGLVGASNLNGDLLVYFFAYVICATFLLLHQTYLTQRGWCVLGTAGSKETGVITLQGLLALFSGIVVLLAATVLVVPLRAAGAHLSLANALKNLVGMQHSSDSSSSNNGPTVDLSDDGTFRVGTGDGMSASDEVVMKVAPEDRSEHYYRGRTYDTYQGNGWVSSIQNQQYALDPVDDQSDVSTNTEYYLRHGNQQGGDATEPDMSHFGEDPPLITKFTLASSQTSMLYLPYGTTEVVVPSSALIHISQSPDNNLSLDQTVENGYWYGTSSVNTDVSPTILIHAQSIRVRCPDYIRRTYIDQKGANIVSVGDQVRLLNTARQIVQSLPPTRRSDFDVANAIRQWVSQRCVYSLDVSAVPSGDDSVSYFLFQSRKGYCDLFASSMAILCRYAGLPSRIATGFDPGVQNDQGGYDLRARDKHAWVEVWFNGYGWQVFDPTQGSAQDTSVDGNHFSSHWFLHFLTKLRLFLEVSGYLPVAIGLCTILGLIYVFKIEVYDKRLKNKGLTGIQSGYRSLTAAQKVSAEAAALYSKNAILSRYYQFEMTLRNCGLSRKPSETPAEFHARLSQKVKDIELGPSFAGDDFIAASFILTDEAMTASYAPLDLVAESLISSELSGSGTKALEVIRQNVPVLRKVLNQINKAAAKNAAADSKKLPV